MGQDLTVGGHRARIDRPGADQDNVGVVRPPAPRPPEQVDELTLSAFGPVNPGQDKTPPRVTALELSGLPAPATRASVQRVVASMCAMVDGYLKPPTSMQVEIGERSEVCFAAGSRFLHVPVLLMVNGAEAAPEAMEHFQGHEFGHALFSELLVRLFPSVRRATELEVAIEAERRGPARAGKDARLAELKRELHASVAWRIVGPYHELFADLAEVLRSRNPSAMAEALGFCRNSSGVIGADTAVQVRDFSHRGSFNKFQLVGHHAALAPTRQFIGQQILENPARAHRPGLVLRKVANALVRDIRARLQDKNGTLSDEAMARNALWHGNVERANEVLIERLRREFAPESNFAGLLPGGPIE